MGVEDPDWRMRQSQDAAAYGGIRIGPLAFANGGFGPYGGGSVAYARRGSGDITPGGQLSLRQDRREIDPKYRSRAAEASRQREQLRRDEASRARYQRGNEVASQLAAINDAEKKKRGKSESRRGRAGGFTSRDLARGPNAAFEATTGSKIYTPNVRTEGTRTFTVRVPRVNTFGGAIASSGNALVSIYSDIWARQRELRIRRQNRLAVGRRGAAATRPINTVGASRTNRTGAGAYASPSAAAAGTSAPVPRSPAANQPAATTPRNALSAPARTDGVSKQLSESKTTTTSRTSTRSPFNVRVNWDPLQMLMNTLAPVRNYFTQAAPTIRRAAPVSSRPVSSSSLTPSQASMVSFSSPGAPSGRCDCPPKRKPTRSTCRNPVVSKKRKGDLVTTVRRIECPPSR